MTSVHAEAIDGSAHVVMFTAPNPGRKTLTGTHTYVVGESDAYLIDPGPDIPDYLDGLSQWMMVNKREPKAILLTHCHPDHAPGASRLRRLLGVPVLASPHFDEGLAGVHTDRPFAPGEIFDMGEDTLQVLDTPGHSPDHVAFWLAQRRVLFVGDTILGRGSTLVAPPDGDMILYLQSLELLRGMSARILAPGHGPLILDPEAKIDEYRRHRQQREEGLLRVLASGPATADELVARLYSDVDVALHDLARGSVLGQLAKLEAEGRVMPMREGFRLTRDAS